jgi:hypothetical protein
MKYALIALLLTAICLAQETPSAPNTSDASSQIPVDQANQQKAKAVLDTSIQALGGTAYLNWTDQEVQGRGYTFHHGRPNSAGVLFWRFRKFPDKERIEFTKKRDVVQIYNGNKGYEVTYKGVRNLDQKDELDKYLRRRHYSLDSVLREWLSQPGIALFYEGRTIAAQKEADQVTVMNSKNEAVTLFMDINTHLPIKKSFKWRDPVDRQLNVEEEIFDNYRPVGNIMTAFDVTRTYNGEMAAQSFMTDAKYNQGLSDTLFDPEAARKK